MASAESFVRFVADQGRGAGALTWRKMFGEYALYLDGKVVALICDDQLFVRPTSAGRDVLDGQVVEGTPYPGARPHLLVVGELEEPALLARLLRATAAAIPAPRPRATRTDAASSKKAKTPARPTAARKRRPPCKA